MKRASTEDFSKEKTKQNKRLFYMSVLKIDLLLFQREVALRLGHHNYLIQFQSIFGEFEFV